MEVQLSLRNVMSKSDWEKIKQDISYDFAEDNFFTELKEGEILTNRIQILQQADQFLGKYFSKDYLVTNIMRMTEKEWDEMKDQIEEEKASGEITPMDLQQNMGGPEMGMPGDFDDGAGGFPTDQTQMGYNQDEMDDEDPNVMTKGANGAAKPKKRLAASKEIDAANMLIEKLWKDNCGEE